MKIFNKNSILTLFVACLTLLALGFAEPMAAIAATTPNLGAATSYAILASTFTNTTAGTTVNGDIGFTTGAPVHPAGAQARYGNTPPYTTAGTDQGAALAALAAQSPCTTTWGGPIDLGTDVIHGTIGVYAPGIYCSGGAMNISATITLTGAGTYIFRAVGALTSSPGAIVALAGASPCDVFWTPTQATTLSANTTMIGTDIDAAGITVGSTTNWSGRLLAFGGTVTTDTDTINVPPTCAGTPPAGSNGPVVVPPLIDVLKVPNPLALPGGPGPVTYTYTATNIGTVPMTTVTMVGDTCSPIVLQSGDTNNNGALDVNETWVYTCTTTLAATHTNTVTATGYYLGQSTTHIASATVIVGAAIIPPLIHVVKTPNMFVTPSANGGLVTYTYNLTNPGTVALSNVTLTDNFCSGISGHTGDINADNLLDPTETWTYTCTSNLTATTTNTATATGTANGITATDVATATVVVPSLAPAAIVAPPLPAAGFAPEKKNTPWGIVIPTAGIFLGLFSSYLMRKKLTA